jgi:hypothetical protein
LALPGPTTVEATGADGAPVTYAVTATDDIAPDPTVTCSPASGTTLPLGTTTVTCEATDTAGNVATGAFDVTIHDTTPPRGDDSSDFFDLQTEVESWRPFRMWFWAYVRAHVIDDVDPSPEVACDVPDGFVTSSVGRNHPRESTCTATDSANNTAVFRVDLSVFCDTASRYRPRSRCARRERAGRSSPGPR